MSHPAYENYKQTIKNEIREIPSHWDLVRLKNILESKITDGPHSTPEFIDSGIPFLSVDSIQDGELIFDNCRYISVDDHLEFSKKAKPVLNDILLAKAASTGKVARVKSDIEFNIWSPLALIRVKQSAADPVFVEYILKSTTTQVQIENLCTSNTQKNISMDDIPKVFFALPPIAEQKAIADFLEHETVKIDKLISEQERLIELLKEKRQAVISHAVTKGKSSASQMRDSCIAWLGEIPSHWEVKPFGHLCPYLSYGFTNPMPTADDGPFMLTANDIDYGNIRYETARNTTEDAFQNLLTNKSRPQAGDILITKDGTLGRIALHDGQRACINQSVALARPDQTTIIPEFLCSALMGGVYQDRMIYEAGGTTIKHIYISRLAKMPIAVPPISEQKIILSQLNNDLSRQDQLISDGRSLIDLLSERRSAIISAAVTGKIDVRNYSPKDAEAA